MNLLDRNKQIALTLSSKDIKNLREEIKKGKFAWDSKSLSYIRQSAEIKNNSQRKKLFVNYFNKPIIRKRRVEIAELLMLELFPINKNYNRD